MKKVLTYGTFDLCHKGHKKILERAKKLGDYLIVGVTSEHYDKERGKLNVEQTLEERIKNVQDLGIADKIIVENFEGQKITDIQKYGVNIFVIGSDWTGKFDYLKEYCDVMYLDRTPGVSSTQLRNENKIIKIGVVGCGRIAKRFIKESKYVSGIEVIGVFSRTYEKAKLFYNEFELQFVAKTYDELLEKVDAIYIATPHETHYNYAKYGLERNKHILCEKPIVLKEQELNKLYEISKLKKRVLMEGIKTAYCPGFERLIEVSKSGIIGQIIDVEAAFTKLESLNSRELSCEKYGGSLTELSSYPLFAIIKLLGKPLDITFKTILDNNLIDIYTKIFLGYKGAMATAKIGLGVKSEGQLIISGTKGYVKVKSPWWKTQEFEVCYEDINKNKKYFYKYEEDGLRYEIAEFIKLIKTQELDSYKLRREEMNEIIKIIEYVHKKIKKDSQI